MQDTEQKLRAALEAIENANALNPCPMYLDGANKLREVISVMTQAVPDERDKVDAERYRWLREQNDDDFAFAVVKNPHFDVYESPEELDAAIDAAIAARAKGGAA